MRASAVEINDRRAQKSGVIFITGANGFLGSHIAASLLRDGFKIMVLCREKKNVSAIERVGQVMAWHGIRNQASIEIVDGDVCKPLLGLSEATFYDVAGRIAEIIHCASNTSFVPEHQAEIESVNITGTKHILDLAQVGACSFFHYISTAYVGGKGHIVCPERIEPTNAYQNFYELSKSKAEKLVIDACIPAGIRVSIYRPSIIIGDSITGKTLLFNAMYYPIKMMHYLRELFREDFMNHNGQNAALMGVVMHKDGSFHIPIRIEKSCYHDQGSINIVPIDYVIQAFHTIMRHDLEGGIYHIVNKQPNTLETLLNFTQKFLKISGVQACDTNSLTTEPMTALERQFDSFIKIYKPYMSDERQFETTHADAILDQYHVTCPVLDYSLFTKCISFAIENNWQNPMGHASKSKGFQLMMS